MSLLVGPTAFGLLIGGALVACALFALVLLGLLLRDWLRGELW